MTQKFSWKSTIFNLLKTRHFFLVRHISHFMEAPTMTHEKTTKWILHCIKGTLDHDLYYSPSHNFKLVRYSDSDWGDDIKFWKSTTSFAFSWEMSHLFGPHGRSNLLWHFKLVKWNFLWQHHVYVMQFGSKICWRSLIFHKKNQQKSMWTTNQLLQY